MKDYQETVAALDHNGVLGELTGVDLSCRDSLVSQEFKDLNERIDKARNRARRGRPEAVDGSRLSGVNHGDTYLVLPDGKVDRALHPYPEVEGLIATMNGPQRAESPSPEEPARLRSIFLRCAYNGLWSPSGTNWQPVRAVELSRKEATALCGALNLPRSWPEAPAMAILSRRVYDSLLDDVAKVCLHQQHSHAESIDPGIYLFASTATAAARGCSSHALLLNGQAAPGLLALQNLLQDRRSALGRLREEGEEAKVEGLCRDIEQGHYRLNAIFWAWGGSDQKSAFDRLVEARSTQRVASPSRSLPVEAFLPIWHLAHATLPAAMRPRVAQATFPMDSPVLEAIGQAMHEELYGQGADLKTGAGGKGGVLEALNLHNLTRWMDQIQPGSTAPLLSLGLPLEEAARLVPMPASCIPGHLLRALLAGKLRLEKDIVLDRWGHPLTIGHFLRTVRQVAMGFGRFFLGFRNTHPLCSILLARVRDEDPHHVFLSLGQVAAAMTFLCRSRGLTSVIKSGPIEFARDKIAQLVAQHTPDPQLAEAVASGEMVPLLTFQMGHPLKGSDIISSEGTDDHDGLAERLRDRRAPRTSVGNHYFPTPKL